MFLFFLFVFFLKKKNRCYFGVWVSLARRSDIVKKLTYISDKTTQHHWLAFATYINECPPIFPVRSTFHRDRQTAMGDRASREEVARPVEANLKIARQKREFGVYDDTEKKILSIARNTCGKSLQ